MVSLLQNKISDLSKQVATGSFRALARAITLVENELPGYESLLLSLKSDFHPRIVGITGPPGAGKSTLVNALMDHWSKHQKKIAVLAVDPSSPFNYGALLGDRIRMGGHYNNPNIFIRSLASRGALGGLSAKIIEITDVIRATPLDYILIETVGVGQSEVEISGLADCTVVTLVPEAGDEVQTLKAGIMEIADIFVVNKSDREGADILFKNLRALVHKRKHEGTEIPVIKTVANKQTGIETLVAAIEQKLTELDRNTTKKIHLLVEKAWQLIQTRKMKNINKHILEADLQTALNREDFNLYVFAEQYL